MKKAFTKAAIGLAGAAFAVVTGAGIAQAATEAPATATPAKQETTVSAQVSSEAKFEKTAATGVSTAPWHPSTRGHYGLGRDGHPAHPKVNGVSATSIGSNGKGYKITLAAKQVFGPDDARIPNRPAAPGYHWVPGHGISGKGSGMQWIPAYQAPN